MDETDLAFVQSLRAQIENSVEFIGAENFEDYYNFVLSVIKTMQRRSQSVGRPLRLELAFAIFMNNSTYAEDIHFMIKHMND